MKYKVGDRVRLISKPSKYTTANIEKSLGKVVTISGMGTSIFSTNYYTIEEDDDYIHYFEDTIAGLASETPFDFGAWAGKKVCMHCKTEEESEDFRREMAKAGLRWSSGESYLEMSCFNAYKDLTCYYFNEGAYDSAEYAKNRGDQILEWSKYRSTEPPKEEQEKEMKTKIDDKPLSYCRAIEIWNKLCNSYNEKECIEKCPLHFNQNKYGVRCEVILKKHPSEAETILKQWAAEHPVKTNRDKFVELFGEIQKYDDGCEHHCATVPCQSCDWWHQEYVEPCKEK